MSAEELAQALVKEYFQLKGCTESYNYYERETTAFKRFSKAQLVYMLSLQKLIKHVDQQQIKKLRAKQRKQEVEVSQQVKLKNAVDKKQQQTKQKIQQQTQTKLRAPKLSLLEYVTSTLCQRAIKENIRQSLATQAALDQRSPGNKRKLQPSKSKLVKLRHTTSTDQARPILRRQRRDRQSPEQFKLVSSQSVLLSL